MTPATPMIGSPINAAIFCAPISLMVLSSSSIKKSVA